MFANIKLILKMDLFIFFEPYIIYQHYSELLNRNINTGIFLKIYFTVEENWKVLLRVEKSVFNRRIIVAVRRESIAGMHYCAYVSSFVTSVDRNADLPIPERIRYDPLTSQPNSLVHTNPHC